jgi:hypothetical protein
MYQLNFLQEFAKAVELEFVKTDLIPTFTNLSSDEQVLYVCLFIVSFVACSKNNLNVQYLLHCRKQAIGYYKKSETPKRFIQS